MGLDHPYWVEDSNFDLEFHVRHIALPKPGDWRQLCIQVARLHSRGRRPQPPAVGGVRHRGTRQRGGRAAGQLRAAAEDAPRRRRRRVGHGDHERRSTTSSPTPSGPSTPATGGPSPTRTRGRCSPAPASTTLKRPMHFARVLGRTVPTLGRAQQPAPAQRAEAAGGRCAPHPLQRQGLGAPRRRRLLPPAGRDAGHQGDRARRHDQRRGAHRRRRRAAPLPERRRASCPTRRWWRMAPISVRSEDQMRAAGNQVTGHAGAARAPTSPTRGPGWPPCGSRPTSRRSSAPPSAPRR